MVKPCKSAGAVALLCCVAAVFAASPFTDSFTGTNGDDLSAYAPSNWEGIGAAAENEIQSNQVLCSIAGECWNRLVDGTIADSGQCAQVDITDSDASGDGGPMIYVQSGTTIKGYVVDVGQDYAELYRVDDGFSSYALLDSDTTTNSDGDEYKLCKVGANIKGYRNDAEILSSSDTTYTSGEPGLFSYDTSWDMDNYEATDTAGGGGSSPRPWLYIRQ